IGELSENQLHNSLKKYYFQKGDIIEHKLEGYYIDIYRENTLIEIQTSSFSKVKRKYDNLLKNYKIIMVYPISSSKWISKIGRDEKITKRKSPKSENIYNIFDELVSIPNYINHQNFSIEVINIHQEEIRKTIIPKRRYRKNWKTVDRKLIKVISTHLFTNKFDFIKLLPQNLPQEFTTKDVLVTSKISKSSIQKMIYCLNKMNAITEIGKLGRYKLYKINNK
ncbi:MAG: hypothetical protein VW886_05120, partial [Candidatus Heimdallarchaeota archaeon]